MANPTIKAVTKIPDIKLVGSKIRREFRATIKEAHLEAVAKAKDILKTSIMFTKSVATGNLLKSVSARFVSNPNVDGYTTEIGFKRPASSYAYYANYGRDAGGFPPRRVMLRWARAKGIDESLVYPISRKIAREGTDGKNFMEDAEPKIEKMREQVIRKAVTKFTRGRK